MQFNDIKNHEFICIHNKKSCRDLLIMVIDSSCLTSFKIITLYLDIIP